MSPVDYRESVGGRAKLESSAPEFNSEPCARIKTVELDQRLESRRNRIARWSQHFSELGENPVDLPNLLHLELANAIPRLHSGRRLDEQGCPGRRCVVDDSANGRARFPPHGDYEAPVSHRYRHVVNLLVRLEPRDEALEKLDELTLRP